MCGSMSRIVFRGRNKFSKRPNCYPVNDHLPHPVNLLSVRRDVIPRCLNNNQWKGRKDGYAWTHLVPHLSCFVSTTKEADLIDRLHPNDHLFLSISIRLWVTVPIFCWSHAISLTSSSILHRIEGNCKDLKVVIQHTRQLMQGPKKDAKEDHKEWRTLVVSPS